MRPIVPVSNKPFRPISKFQNSAEIAEYGHHTADDPHPSEHLIAEGLERRVIRGGRNGRFSQLRNNGSPDQLRRCDILSVHLTEGQGDIGGVLQPPPEGL